MDPEEREVMLRKLAATIIIPSMEPEGFYEVAELVLDMDKRLKALEKQIVRYRKIDKEHDEVS